VLRGGLGSWRQNHLRLPSKALNNIEKQVIEQTPRLAYIALIPVISSMTQGFAFSKGRAERKGEFAMTTAPLMPKATAVWLVENTALSFDQIAQFCSLHPLEVKAIADGDAAQGIKGLDPILTGQLTREQIEQAEGDPEM
jgi:Transcriptional cell cycle regulator TrcR